MVEFQEHDRPRQTGNNYANRDATAQIESSPPHESRHLKPNQLDSVGRRTKNSRSHRKRVRKPRLGVDAGSMASTESDPETSNTSMSEGQQEPPANDGALERDKLSLGERKPSRDHVDDNPIAPNLPAQPTTSGPISNEDSGVATPHPLHLEGLEGRDVPSSKVAGLLEPIKPTEARNPIQREYSTVSAGPLYPTPNPARINETTGVIGETVGKARLTSSSIFAAKHPSTEEFEIISTGDMDPTDDDCNKSLDLHWLCTHDRKERGYMELIPYSLSSVEPLKVFIRPSNAEMQRVAQLRLNVRRLRREIQDLKALLRAKDQQIFNENEEAFKRLREFVVERHRRPKIHDSTLELASRLFFASRSSRDECGPLNEEISSLEERLELEEIQLTQAEDSLYESFGIPPMESGESQGNGIATRGFPILQSPPTLDNEHNPASQIHKTEGDDDDSDYGAYSTGSFEKYRKNYHPLYIEYQEHRGTQDNLYERRAYILQDQARLEDQQQNRHRVGLTLLEDDQNYLDSLPEVIRLLDIEIDEYRLEIEELRAQCLEQGVIDEDDNYIDEGREDSNASNSNDSTPPPPPPPLPPLPPSAPPKPPVPILPPQITKTPNGPSSLPTTAHYIIVKNLGTRLDDQSYQNRINPWLLGKLAASRAELTLLATILSAMDAEPDVASLLDVFKLWDHDGAGMEPPERPGKLDGATVNKLRRVTRGVVGDGFDRALVSSLFGLSLWGGEAYGGSAETAYLDDIVGEGS